MAFERIKRHGEQDESVTGLIFFVAAVKKYHCSTIKNHNISLKTQPLKSKTPVRWHNIWISF